MVDDEQLAVWRSFLNAHARVTRAIGRDLAGTGVDVPMTVPWLPLGALTATCAGLALAAALAGVRGHTPVRAAAITVD